MQDRHRRRPRGHVQLSSSWWCDSPAGEQKEARLPLREYLQIVAATNFKQRVRKTVEYYHADRLNYAVIGTPNRLEYDQGFFVKNGDGAADVKPIAHLYKTQVYALARHLGMPEEICTRAADHRHLQPRRRARTSSTSRCRTTRWTSRSGPTTTACRPPSWPRASAHREPGRVHLPRHRSQAQRHALPARGAVAHRAGTAGLAVSEALGGLPERSAARFRHWERHLAGRLVPLPDQPAESVFTTLAALWHAAAGRPLSSRAASHATLPDLDEAGFAKLEGLVERRLEGTPLAHLTGRQHFMGLEMLASADALIPREETELVGRAALAALQEAAERTGSARAIDLCTGSGNLALALAWHEPRAHVWGADLSTRAVALARRNAEYLGLAQRVDAGGRRPARSFRYVDFRRHGRRRLLQPPYISSAKVETMAEEIRGHEPRLAFDGGPFGIRILARLIDGAPRLLKPGGVLAFEVGLGQGPGIRRRLERGNTWTDIAEIVDGAGETRALTARLQAGPA